MRVAISEAGVKHLRQLSQDLIQLNNQIEESGEELLRTVQSIGGDLGIYQDKILLIAKQVKSAQDSSHEDIQILAKAVVNKSNSIEQMVRRIQGK